MKPKENLFNGKYNAKFNCAWICINCQAEIDVTTKLVIVESVAGQVIVCETPGCGEVYTITPEGAIPHSVVKRMRESEG